MRPEGPRAGLGFLEGGSKPLSISYGVWESAVSSPRGVKFVFWSIFGPQKSRQIGKLAFDSGGNK